MIHSKHRNSALPLYRHINTILTYSISVFLTPSPAHTCPFIVSTTHYSRLQFHLSTFSLSDLKCFAVQFLWKWFCFRSPLLEIICLGTSSAVKQRPALNVSISSQEAKGLSLVGRWEKEERASGLGASLKFPSFLFLTQKMTELQNYPTRENQLKDHKIILVIRNDSAEGHNVGRV